MGDEFKLTINEGWNVEELINRLSKVKDKKKIVYISVDKEVSGNFEVIEESGFVTLND